jgi:hypothetical protein
MHGVLVRAAVVTLLLSVACGTPAPSPVDAGSVGGGAGGSSVLCGPSSCTGCCTPEGACVTATTDARCGTSGNLCATCGLGQSCNGAECVVTSGGGTAGGSAGGTAGGSAGGVAGGSAGGVAGGSAGGVAGGSAGGVAGGSSGGVAGGSAGGSTNQAPFVNGIVVTRSGSSTPLTGTTIAGQVLQFTADVLDAENDPLTLTWSVDGGTLSDPMAMAPTWYSPVVNLFSSAQGALPVFPVAVSVSDGVNPPVTAMVDVTVRAPQLFDLLSVGGVLGRTTPGGCASSACHGNAATPAGGLRIQPTNTSATRTALLANTAKAGCTPMARVSPSNPSNSLLIRKVDPSTILVMPSCGARMPLSSISPPLPGTPLPPHEIIGLRSWVAAGAPP